MATKIIQPSPIINVSYNGCNTISSMNFSKSYFDNDDHQDEVKLNDVEFEDDEMSGGPAKERVYQLFDDKANLGVPVDILNKAEQISKQMVRAVHNRKNRRKRRQFVCLYNAYEQLNIEVFSPQGVADIVGLPHEEISPAFTDFSPLRSGYKPRKRVRTTIHPSTRIAADYAKKLDFTDADIEHAKMIISDALISNPRIKARKPATIAIGGIAACVYLRNKDVSYKQMYEISLVSESTIKQTKNDILAAYNS
jgi:hypothetical protein